MTTCDQENNSSMPKQMFYHTRWSIIICEPLEVILSFLIIHGIKLIQRKIQAVTSIPNTVSTTKKPQDTCIAFNHTANQGSRKKIKWFLELSKKNPYIQIKKSNYFKKSIQIDILLPSSIECLDGRSPMKNTMTKKVVFISLVLFSIQILWSRGTQESFWIGNNGLKFSVSFPIIAVLELRPSAITHCTSQTNHTYRYSTFLSNKIWLVTQR